MALVKKPVSEAEPAASAASLDDPIATVEAMILELDELRADERNAAILGALPRGDRPAARACLPTSDAA